MTSGFEGEVNQELQALFAVEDAQRTAEAAQQEADRVAEEAREAARRAAMPEALGLVADFRDIMTRHNVPSHRLQVDAVDTGVVGWRTFDDIVTPTDDPYGAFSSGYGAAAAATTTRVGGELFVTEDGLVVPIRDSIAGGPYTIEEIMYKPVQLTYDVLRAVGYYDRPRFIPIEEYQQAYLDSGSGLARDFALWRPLLVKSAVIWLHHSKNKRNAPGQDLAQGQQ